MNRTNVIISAMELDLGQVLEAMPDAVMVIDTDFTVLDFRRRG